MFFNSFTNIHWFSTRLNVDLIVVYYGTHNWTLKYFEMEVDFILTNATEREMNEFLEWDSAQCYFHPNTKLKQRYKNKYLLQQKLAGNSQFKHKYINGHKFRQNTYKDTK